MDAAHPFAPSGFASGPPPEEAGRVTPMVLDGSTCPVGTLMPWGELFVFTVPVESAIHPITWAPLDETRLPEESKLNDPARV